MAPINRPDLMANNADVIALGNRDNTAAFESAPGTIAWRKLLWPLAWQL